jgi:hypothetical protein
MVGLNSRSLKALAIAANATHWQRLGPDTFRVPSQSDPAQTYLVTPQACSCLSSQRHPERLCKHQLSVAIVVTLLEQDEAPPAPKPPLTEAEVAALFARLA